jgi:hypothetical protein
MSVPQYQPPQYKPVVQAPVVQPVSVPFQQTQTYKKQTNISLRTDEKPKVITGPNYNRLAKGWKIGGDQRDGKKQFSSFCKLWGKIFQTVFFLESIEF